MFMCSVVLALALAPADKPAAGDKKAADALAGYWDVTGTEREGVRSKEFLYTRLVFTGEKLTASRAQQPGALKGSEERHEARYRLDAASKGIEVKFLTGPDQGKTFYGVYELKGDELKVCWGESKEKRPTTLSTKKGSDAVLLVLKRGKP